MKSKYTKFQPSMLPPYVLSGTSGFLDFNRVDEVDARGVGVDRRHFPQLQPFVIYSLQVGTVVVTSSVFNKKLETLQKTLKNKF